ncbi:MAG: hypothetical protein IAE80_29295 [Anaerolinea sp.]|nr:hypothetical protein [Anaerolinea sp.]
MLRHWSNFRVLAVIIVSFMCLNLTVYMSEAQIPSVMPVGWSYDGSQIAIVIGQTVELRNTDTRQLLHTLRGHSDIVYTTAWSPNRMLIATGSFDATVKVWDAINGELRTTLMATLPVFAIVWPPDGTQIIGFSSDGDSEFLLSIWDIDEESLIESYHGGAVIDAVFTDDSQSLAVITPLSVHIFETDAFSVRASSPRTACCTNRFSSVVWSPDEQKIATASVNGLVTVWDIDDSSLTQARQFIANPFSQPDSREVPDLSLSWVRDLFWGAEPDTIQAVSGDGTVRMWNVVTGEMLQEEQIGRLDTTAWSPYGARLAVVSSNPLSSTVVGPDGALSVVTPFATLERLQSIAALCDAPLTVTDAIPQVEQTAALTDFVAQVTALPEGTIPPACAADLIAVAEAISAGQ